MSKRIYSISLFLLGSFLFCYVLFRAVLLSLTHDESATTDLVSVSLADIMFAPNQFQTANNHILHSIFMKWSVLFFGWKEWAIRLPNVLLFVLYFCASVWYATRLTQNHFLRLAAIFIICSVPYLLDFFSLARGYGMANAFSFAALAALIGFFHDQKKKYLLFTFSFAALAVYSNFTWLNIYLGLWLLLNCGIILFYRKENNRSLIRSFITHNIYPLVIGLLLALLIYKPISYLKKQDEFKWGSSEWLVSFKSFINDLLYGHPLFFTTQEGSARIICYFLIVAVCISVALLVRHLIRYKQNAFHTFYAKATLLSLLLLLIILTSTVAQRHLLNTYYVDGRKATLYIPILLSLIASSAVWFREKYSNAGNTYWILLSSISLLQFYLSFNFTHCREWWYDATSKHALQAICSDSTSAKETGVNWLFIHSFHVYNKHFYKNCLPAIVRTDASPDQLTDIDYYYIIGDEIRTIHPVYKPVKRFFWDRFLLKKDEAAYEVTLSTYIQANRIIYPNLSEQQLRVAAEAALFKQRKELNWAALFFTD